jgi:hypothetical protein
LAYVRIHQGNLLSEPRQQRQENGTPDLSTTDLALRDG